LVNAVANGLPATLFLLFVEHVLRSGDEAGLLLLVYFLCGVLGVPLWVQLSRRFGKNRTWCAAMLASCAVFVWVPLLGAGDVWWFVAVCVLTGLCVGADLVLPSAMQADVVDEDTAVSGAQRTGLFFAVWSMATKMSLALAVGLAFPILDWTGFSETGDNTAGALLMLAVLYGLVPVIFKLAAIVLMRGYELTPERQAALRERLAQPAAADWELRGTCGPPRPVERGVLRSDET
ncbi:MAG: MFS transporter, partial [Alphaproteobacteria bacterium]|nr:MFS transporter [Alphaproteobacteria bacterium]